MQVLASRSFVETHSSLPIRLPIKHGIKGVDSMATAARTMNSFAEPLPRNEASSSAVSWASVLAGAFVASALSLILMALGAGMSLSALSPWPNGGLNASRVGMGAIAWLIFVQIVASATGGYLAGRLRTKWVAVHTHEVYFRDTAHGFLVWAVGLVISTLFLASYATSVARPSNASAAGETARIGTENQYFVDSLLRSDRPTPGPVDESVRSEVSIILTNSLRYPDMPQQDKTYLAQLVAARAGGLTQTEAEARVSGTLTQYRQAVDTARKAVAHSLYWLFVALLMGAFCASYAATFGGKQRDHVSV
jgi:hypothetical protein